MSEQNNPYRGLGPIAQVVLSNLPGTPSYIQAANQMMMQSALAGNRAASAEASRARAAEVNQRMKDRAEALAKYNIDTPEGVAMRAGGAWGSNLGNWQDEIRTREQYKLMQKAQQQPGLTPLQIANMGSRFTTGRDLGNLFGLAYNKIPVHPNTGEPLGESAEKTLGLYQKSLEQQGLARAGRAAKSFADVERIRFALRNIDPLRAEKFASTIENIKGKTALDVGKLKEQEWKTLLTQNKNIAQQLENEKTKATSQDQIDAIEETLKNLQRTGQLLEGKIAYKKQQTKAKTLENKLFEKTMPFTYKQVVLDAKKTEQQIENLKGVQNKDEAMTQLAITRRQLTGLQATHQRLENEEQQETSQDRIATIRFAKDKTKAQLDNLKEQYNILGQKFSQAMQEVESGAQDIALKELKLEQESLNVELLEKQLKVGGKDVNLRMKTMDVVDDETGERRKEVFTFNPSTGMLSDEPIMTYKPPPRVGTRTVTAPDGTITEQFINKDELLKGNKDKAILGTSPKGKSPQMIAFEKSKNKIGLFKQQVGRVLHAVQMQPSLVGIQGFSRKLGEYYRSAMGSTNTPAINFAEDLKILALQLQETVTTETGKFTEGDVARINAIVGKDDLLATAGGVKRNFRTILGILESKHPSFDQAFIESIEKLPNARMQEYHHPKNPYAVLLWNNKAGKWITKYR